MVTILDEWGTTPDDLTDIVRGNPSLRGMIFGYVAEWKLRELFTRDKRITAVRKDDDHDRRKKGDLVITYCGREFKLESKSLQTTLIKPLGGVRFDGGVQCDASDRRVITVGHGKSVNTTCLMFGEFDILAACLFHYRHKWDFGFALNEQLPCSNYKGYPPEVQKKLIKSFIPVPWPLRAPFVADPFILLDELVRRR